ncbi:MAG TPA: hypothetical protein VFW38_04550 [Solirubrobacteraceae bacterium]|nr:hypothetical protein [Solirubrobacteraceae bacterium]
MATAPAAVADRPGSTRTALVALLAPSSPALGDEVERELQSIPGLSVGLLSTAQGNYTQASLFADIGHASRVASVAGRLSVVSLPAGREGCSRLRTLMRERRAGELVLVLERASGPHAHELRWAAIAGAANRGDTTLSSQTTREHGLIAAVDVVPTVLAYLRLPIPTSIHGRSIHSDGRLDGDWLRRLRARLETIYPRRLPALVCLLGAWALLLALAATPLPRSSRAARVKRALRIGALALLWTPLAALPPAAIEPSAAGEYALIVATAFALGALTDALLPWPRGPIVPAVSAVVALSFDALAGTQLLMRSLLGPNPAYGSRFYGIGNELKPALAVLVFAAVAAALYGARRSRRGAVAMAGAGVLLAVVEGSALIGAGVGGVVLVSAGTAVAIVLLLPGSLQRARLLAIVLAPIVGLALLAALDLATAKGAGHFTGSVLQAHSLGDLQDLMTGRYRAAWHELGNGLMPMATAAAVLIVPAGVRYRERVLAPVAFDPAWQAAFAGGLSAGVVGALIEDSGPVLLLVAVFALACVLGYLWGAPQPNAATTTASEHSRGTVPALSPQHDLVL